MYNENVISIIKNVAVLLDQFSFIVIEAVTIPIGAGTLTVVVLLVVVVIVVIMIKVKRNGELQSIIIISKSSIPTGQYNLLKARSITYIITMCFTGIKQTTEVKKAKRNFVLQK